MSHSPFIIFDIISNRHFLPFDIIFHSAFFCHFVITYHSTFCPFDVFLPSNIFPVDLLSHLTFCPFDVFLPSNILPVDLLSHLTFCPSTFFYCWRFYFHILSVNLAENRRIPEKNYIVVENSTFLSCVLGRVRNLQVFHDYCFNRNSSTYVILYSGWILKNCVPKNR